jgi:hypothetical protein
MGSSNVALVYALWGHLPDHAFRLLGYMALVTLDADEPPIFWQGVPALALALGRDLPEDPDGDNSIEAEVIRKTRKAVLRIVSRAVSVCISEGVVRVIRKPSPGRHAVYSLHLSRAVSNPVDNGVDDAPRDGADESRTTSGVPDVRRPVSQRATSGVVRDGGIKGGRLTTKEEQNEEQTQLPSSPHQGLSTDEIEKRYLAARTILEKLPDLGMKYLARVEEIAGLKERVIMAGELAALDRKRTRRSAS